MDDKTDWQTRALTPLDLKKSHSGVGCPRCDSPNFVLHRTLWRRFGIFLAVFVVFEAVAQLLSMDLEDGNRFKETLFIIGVGAAGLTIYHFFAAVFGSNKCSDCNHRWY